ncbi:MAG TPA: esterase-like activity of phytase family protein [Azospirillaceae bacterium]|nr:esterase-like activity of phytase family protein [Azospirillaceae bacterium]
MLFLTACGAAVGGTSSRPVAVDPGRLSDRVFGDLAFRGAVAISSDEQVGGLSAIEVMDGGARFVAVSDAGRVVTGRMRYDATGGLSDVEDFEIRPLLGRDGKRFTGPASDTEGLARLPDGRWAVSAERVQHIVLYPAGPAPAGPAERILYPTGLGNLSPNGGLEAVTALPDGRLVVIAEGRDNGQPERSAAIGGPNGWVRWTYRAAPDFRPTAAATLPNGDILVLERKFSFFSGLLGRITRVAARDIGSGAVVEGREIGRLDWPLPMANFEGISIARRPDGRLFLYLVSDDNFSAVLPTLIICFELAE